MSWAGRPRRATRYVVYEGVEFLDSTAKSVKVRFPEGRERFISLSQMPKGFAWEVGKVGKVGDLEVSEWFDEKLADDLDGPDEEEVEVPDVVVLRESAKALCVRWAGGEDWVPKGQIRSRSGVKNDGDRGTLVVSRWIAEQKNMVEGAAGGRGESRRAPDSDVARDVRGGAPDRQKDLFAEYFPPPDPDDDIPF